MELQLRWLDSWTADCAARHFGIWLIEPTWFCLAARAVSEGTWRPEAGRLPKPPAAEDPPEAPVEKPYQMDGTGLAVIPIQGQMMKGASKYGGANTVDIRRKVRSAVADPDVKGIMLAIDSPGGTVSGTEELGADVAAARRVKPTFAHIDDLGASAAYWVASQADRITASSTSEVGSIGTMAVIEDISAVAEKRGIKVHVLSTGPYKGAGVSGTVVTPEQLEYFQSRVDAINQHFLAAVATGRNVSIPKVQEWADGRVWLADTARQKGLIDGVMLFDEAMAAARDYINRRDTPIEIPKTKRDAKSAIAAMEKMLEMQMEIDTIGNQ